MYRIMISSEDHLKLESLRTWKKFSRMSNEEIIHWILNEPNVADIIYMTAKRSE